MKTVKLYDEGMAIHTLARRFNVSRGCIVEALEDFGRKIEPRPGKRGKDPSPEEIEERARIIREEGFYSKESNLWHPPWSNEVRESRMYGRQLFQVTIPVLPDDTFVEGFHYRDCFV